MHDEVERTDDEAHEARHNAHDGQNETGAAELLGAPHVLLRAPTCEKAEDRTHYAARPHATARRHRSQCYMQDTAMAGFVLKVVCLKACGITRYDMKYGAVS